MTTPTPAQQLEEDKDTLRFILSGYPKGRYTLERRAIARALAALEAVEHLAANAYDHHTPHMICIPVDEWKAAMKRLPADAMEVRRG